MGHTPNRLEDHWTALKPLLLQEWVELSEADLMDIDCRFDKLVELIRRRYGGRLEIIQEAKIRDTLNHLLHQIEAPSD